MYRPTISYRDFMFQLPVGIFKIIWGDQRFKGAFFGEISFADGTGNDSKKNKKGIPLKSKNTLFTLNRKLNHGDICSRRTFLSLLYVKGNLVAFIEGFKTGRVDC